MGGADTYIPRAAADITLIQRGRALTLVITVALRSAETHALAVRVEADPVAVVSRLRTGAPTHTATVHLLAKSRAFGGGAHRGVAVRRWRKCQHADMQVS